MSFAFFPFTGPDSVFCILISISLFPICHDLPWRWVQWHMAVSTYSKGGILGHCLTPSFAWLPNFHLPYSDACKFTTASYLTGINSDIHTVLCKSLINIWTHWTRNLHEETHVINSICYFCANQITDSEANRITLESSSCWNS